MTQAIKIKSTPRYNFKCNSVSFPNAIFVHTSSKLKRTPPIGAPKATETPAAEAADSTYKENMACS